MKLQVAPYNNGATTWTEAEETAIISYKITHRLGSPAEAEIILSDPTGVIARKYNVDANDVFVGPGKITIEDPTATDIFFGRIMRAEANTDARTVTLYCQDWLSQLDEEQITYDMREDLDGSGLRESTLLPDYDDTDGNGIIPAFFAGVLTYVYDHHGLGWAHDQFANMYFVLSDRMAGNITVKTGPYACAATSTGPPMAVETFTNDVGDLWTEDTDHYNATDFSAFYVDMNFRVWCPDSSTWYQSTRDNTCKVTMTYKGSTAGGTLQLWNGGTFDTLGLVPGTGNTITKTTFGIPNNLLATMFDANGEVIIRYNESTAGGGGVLIYFIEVECGFVTIGYSGATAITLVDNGNRLAVAVRFDTDAYKVWSCLPYSITRPIYKHIASDETPGTLITAGDTMETLTCAATIEHTSGTSTRQYKDQTRLQILQDLARQDKAEFFIPLGTTTVTYKSTWNDGAPTALTDTDVNSWKSTFDYGKLANEFNIYGMRIGDRQLYSNVTDATSILKYKATRSRTERGSGLVSEHDTLAYGTALVAQYKDVQQILTTTIRGNTAKVAHPKTLVLGDEVSITSTYLGLAAAKYIIQNWSYDSTADMTTLLLHPRVSQVGLQPEEFGSMDQALQTSRKGDTDKFIAAPESNTIA